MKKILKWINLHILGGKKKIWKEELLKKYRDQSGFDFKISPITIEYTYTDLSMNRSRDRCLRYVCGYSVDGNNYINIGDHVLDNNKWYVCSYDRGLEVCLKEFERYLETKKVS